MLITQDDCTLCKAITLYDRAYCRSSKKIYIAAARSEHATLVSSAGPTVEARQISDPRRPISFVRHPDIIDPLDNGLRSTTGASYRTSESCSLLASQTRESLRPLRPQQLAVQYRTHRNMFAEEDGLCPD